MDLSKVLDDVYSGGTATSESNVPEWADDAHLDQVFAGWTPGPPADAPAAEREMAAHIEPTRRRIDDELAGALTKALTANPIAPEPLFADRADEDDEVDDELTPAHIDELIALREPARVWTRADDDILPARPAPKSGRRFTRR